MLRRHWHRYLNFVDGLAISRTSSAPTQKLSDSLEQISAWRIARPPQQRLPTDAATTVKTTDRQATTTTEGTSADGGLTAVITGACYYRTSRRRHGRQNPLGWQLRDFDGVTNADALDVNTKMLRRSQGSSSVQRQAADVIVYRRTIVATYPLRYIGTSERLRTIDGRTCLSGVFFYLLIGSWLAGIRPRRLQNKSVWAPAKHDPPR